MDGKHRGGLYRHASAGIKHTAFATGLAAVLQLLQLALLGRFLSAEDFGLLAIVLAIVGLAQTLGGMGLSHAIIQQQEPTRTQLSTLYWLNLAAGGAVYLAAGVLLPLALAGFGLGRIAGLVLLAAPAILIAPAGLQFQALLQKELEFRPIAIVESASALAGFGASLLSLALGGGAACLIWGNLAAAALKSVAFFWLGFRRWRPELVFRIGEVRAQFRFGLYQVGEQFLNYFGNQVDKLLIGALLGPEPLGYYFIAFQLVQRPLALLGPILMRVALPAFARIQDEDAKLRAGFLELIEAAALVWLPVYLGLAVLAGPLLQVFFGDGWQPAAPLLKILAILGLFQSLGNPLGAIILAKGRAALGFYLNLLLAVVNVIAILAGSRFGPAGVAWGLAAAIAIFHFTLGLWLRWSLLRIRPLDYLQALLPFVLFAGIASSGAGWFIRRSLPAAAGSIQLAVGLLLGGGLYVALLWLWKRTLLRKLIALLS